jgi:hypothetical protein
MGRIHHIASMEANMPSDQECPKIAQSSQNLLGRNDGTIPRWRKVIRLVIPLAVIHAAVNVTLKSTLIGSTIPQGAVPALRTVGDLAMYGVFLGAFVGCWMMSVAFVQWVRTRNSHLSG